MKKNHQELFEDHLLNEKQFRFLEAIESNKVISVFGELRLLLYLGVMLFTAGISYLAYNNINNIGHVALMVLITIAIAIGIVYLSKRANPFTWEKSDINHISFDYILLLVALLCISLFSYFQVYFNLVEQLLQLSSFISSAIFFFFAYRYDNKAVLTLGIVVLSAAFGISISPINWIEGNWMVSTALYNIGIFLGLFLIAVGFTSKRLKRKGHFSFSYKNMGFLILYISLIGGMVETFENQSYSLITTIISGAFSFYSWKNKEFLFFLYSAITLYFSGSYLMFNLMESISSDFFIFIIYYIPISLILFIAFLINKKSHFKND